jgi:hypothetical protein
LFLCRPGYQLKRGDVSRRIIVAHAPVSSECEKNHVASIHSAEDEVRKLSLLAVAGFLVALTTPILRAQEGPDIPSRVGVGVKLSLLGVGGEAAFAVTHRTNVRVGFNAFSYGTSVGRDGITYGGNLAFRSVQATYDIFPLGGFHLSPGVLLYNGNSISANVSAAGRRDFHERRGKSPGGSGQDRLSQGCAHVSDWLGKSRPAQPPAYQRKHRSRRGFPGSAARVAGTQWQRLRRIQ